VTFGAHEFSFSPMRTFFFALVVALGFTPAFAGERVTLNFNPDWKFIKADPAGAEAPDFDDRAWATVSAPHTFNDIDTFDDWSTPGHVGEMNQWSGRTWYRKTFVAPKTFAGKKVFIEFEAVRQIAEVYLNGYRLGVSKTGFTPFGFELTTGLRADGGKNVIAVMCDNRFEQETDMRKLVATELPWNSPHWHPAHGGIYRNVFLHVMDPLHISLPLYSFLQTAGPYAYATEITAESAKFNFEVPVENARTTAAEVEMRAEVFDAEGHAILALRDVRKVAAGAAENFRGTGRLTAPRWWEPGYAHLYRVRCALWVNGQLVDSTEIPFGLRQARWDANTGLELNGRPLKLHGWGQKPTDEWPGLGAAQPDWMHFFTLRLMHDAGGNFVRWGHCASGPAMIAAGDRLGIIADQPGVEGEGDARGEAWTIRAAAFRDTLIYFRNHPSILIWEGGNQKVSREHAQELRGLMDKYDPHGGRAYAHRRADEVTAEFMDVGIGTEGGREIARLPVVEGEYDREESPRRVWDDFSPPNFGYPEAKGQTYQLTSEQFAVNEVNQYVKKLGAPNHSGGANWIFSDSTSGGRVAVEVARASGEVDGVRLPKEGYYVCRTMFRADPQVHIIGHWTYPAGTKKTVYVASNGDDVELFLNGRSLGHGKMSDRFLFTFPEIAWAAGEIKAVASSGGKPIASEVKRTAGAPVKLKLSAIAGPEGWRADGSDVVLIDVEAVDANGERCPTFQQRVDFECEGAGVWRGGYNSGKIKSTNNLFLDLEAGINRVAVRATRAGGSVTVKARSEGLAPGSITIEARPVSVEQGMTSELPALPNVVLPGTRPAAVATAMAVKPPPQNGADAAIPAGHLIKAFSYSGPTRGVHVDADAQDAKQIYLDQSVYFDGLPATLKGADFVRFAAADALYNAVDLVELSVPKGVTVSIAHDDRLARPSWLTRQFQVTPQFLTIEGHRLTIYERRVERDESLTLGANTEDSRTRTALMYLVFVSRASQLQ
jgi:beta-galactosidase